MKYIRLFILVTTLGSSALAQSGTISGTVAGRDGRPLDGVQIRLSGTNYSVSTKSDGRYGMVRVPPGVYTVTAVRSGYLTAEITGVSVVANVTRSLDIRMDQGTFTSITNETIAVERPGRETQVVGAAQVRLPMPGDDPFSRCLIPPELVMAHQREINLEDAQRTKLIAEMSQAQAKFTEVQWTLSSEQQKLEQLLKTAAIDEAAALRQLDRILSLEQGLKRSQLTLLLRVKNTLTPRQQEMLNALRYGPVSIVPQCGS
jgi:hypothetical protein